MLNLLAIFGECMLWKKFGTWLNFSSAYQPQADGITKVISRTLGNMLHSIAGNKQK